MNDPKVLDLLIVDDEVLETEYLLTLLPKTGFTFRNIAVAFNVETAQEILLHHPVDIILCDIEMPQGSGLDLLRWVRERKIPCEALIITCHPEFTYAQQAMKLSSVDYLLKPIDLAQLTQGIHRCVELLQQSWAAEEYLHNADKMRDLLFEDLMEDNYFGKEELARRMQAVQLDYTGEEKMVPLYFKMDSSMKRAENGRDFARKTVLINVVQDILFDFNLRPWMFFPEEGAFFVTFRLTELRGSLGNFCEERLRKLLSSSGDLLHIPMTCFVGKLTSFWELSSQYRELREKSSHFLTVRGEICMPSFGPQPSNIIAELFYTDWRLLLENGGFAKLRRKLEPYLEELMMRKIVPAEEVFYLSQKLIRQINRFLHEEQADIQETLTERDQQDLLMQGRFFLEDYVGIVRRILTRLEEAEKVQWSEALITNRICQYVQAHVEDDLDRQILAKTFGLSPEHLSRLFRQEKGYSLVSFLTKTKLDYCCKMFQTTNCSVRQAAERVGYTNFSYFSKLFREHYGCTPQQYKEQLWQSNGTE